MKVKAALLIWTLTLCACSPSVTTPQFPNSSTTPSALPEKNSATEQCAFSWAYSPLEELSRELDSEVKTLSPVANARASAFGEDCLYSDGHKVFHAIETDFYIDLPVTVLTDFESFGNWVLQTMSLVNGLPPDKLEGPHTGFVEYSFAKSQAEHLIIRVPIQTYNETASGKTGEELFLLFYTKGK